jgi:hypothetical protein
LIRTLAALAATALTATASRLATTTLIGALLTTLAAATLAAATTLAALPWRLCTLIGLLAALLLVVVAHEDSPFQSG